MKKIFTIILNVVVIFFLVIGCLIIFSLLPLPGNYKFYAVMSGSMEPTIPVGALVAVKPAPSYRVGDIVTFLPLSAKSKGDTKTHRIIAQKETNGQMAFVTKGDANSIADQNLLYPEQIIGKYILSVAFLGFIVGYAKTVPGLILVIVVPATIIVYEESKKLIAEIERIRAERKRRRRKDRRAQGPQR